MSANTYDPNFEPDVNPLNFYNKYEDDIEQWNADKDGDNEDWAAMKDAYQLSSADKLQNYALQQALAATALNDEKSVMSHSAYLDYENTRALMSEEQQDKIEGLREANTLSKDYLASESAAQESLAEVQGEQAVNLQAKANEATTYQALAGKEAQLGVALTQKEASDYGADAALAGQAIQSASSDYRTDAEKYANTYIADKQKESAKEVADVQKQSALGVAQEQRGSALETEQERSSGSLNVAKEQRGSALDIAKEQRGSALETEQARQTGESSRNTARLESEERRIGLMGQEERRTSRDKRQNAVNLARQMSRRG